MNPFEDWRLKKIAKNKFLTEEDYRNQHTKKIILGKTKWEVVIYDSNLRFLKSYPIAALREHNALEGDAVSRRMRFKFILLLVLLGIFGGTLIQLVHYRGANPRNWRPGDIEPAIYSLFGVRHQIRLRVLESTRCNIDFINRKIRESDRANGFNFGGVFGYKTNCAETGYSDLSEGPFNLPETTSIELACNREGYNAREFIVDGLLKKGAKIISSSPFEATVSVYRRKLQSSSEAMSVITSAAIQSDNSKREEQPGNTCNGTTYVLEGSPFLTTYLQVKE